MYLRGVGERLEEGDQEMGIRQQRRLSVLNTVSFVQWKRRRAKWETKCAFDKFLLLHLLIVLPSCVYTLTKPLHKDQNCLLRDGCRYTDGIWSQNSPGVYNRQAARCFLGRGHRYANSLDLETVAAYRVGGRAGLLHSGRVPDNEH